ncbi:TRAFAC clade GTPase domain-containing protein [Roseateles sp. MS654]|uniref:TRAFAC clade GTPase domain-containing protein n=1 Tax=Roseateles sp. MS654 TaxID=3412685 RepID=UPI003C2B64A6
MIDINAVRAALKDAPDAAEPGAVGAAVLDAPSEAPSFPSSATLGSEVIDKMMASRYVTVVGILGDPDSGKTACLASLYLLVSQGLLDGWSFADSSSLMGLEEIARGARRWNEGNPPQQMTVHTKMADDRQPGFLHLRMKRSGGERIIDLALPDLPGEWTKDLVRSSRSDRFQFLKSADILWVMVDGRTLIDVQRRQGVVSRLGQLAGRLRALFDNSMPQLFIVTTHLDEGSVPEAALTRLHAELAKHNVSAKVMPVASFSANPDIKPGHGLAALIDASVTPHQRLPHFWPPRAPQADPRSFLSHRRLL